jgi:hypothetical protein
VPLHRFGFVVLLFTASAVGAARKPRVPPRPNSWQPGITVKAYAQGPAVIVRDFTWGEERDPASGVLRFSVTDNTWEETENSLDTLGECVARVKVPSEKAEYYVRMTRLRPVGARRATMGGVLIDHPLFGDTDLGGPGLFPRLRAEAAVWGWANVVKNGKVIARDFPALAWVGEAGRDAKGKWLFHADPSRSTAHLIVFGPNGAGKAIPGTVDGFLHFEWPQAKSVRVGEPAPSARL